MFNLYLVYFLLSWDLKWQFHLKETVPLDFRPSVYFRQSITPRPPINTLKYFRSRDTVYLNLLIYVQSISLPV
jgi:hypothetical protein